jgi:hypothetical protein
MIKKFLARCVSEILYYIGHWISFPMSWFDWHWIYPIYNKIMLWSSAVQDWAGNDKPWNKT